MYFCIIHQVNFVQRTLSNWKKDELRKSYSFEEIGETHISMDSPFELELNLAGKQYAFVYFFPSSPLSGSHVFV
jgi:hypothetical protein